jgi:hypothetical protein
MAKMDSDTNSVNDAWFRARMKRDGYNPNEADPPPAWDPDFSFLKK